MEKTGMDYNQPNLKSFKLDFSIYVRKSRKSSSASKLQ